MPNNDWDDNWSEYEARALPEAWPEYDPPEPWGSEDHWKACDSPEDWFKREQAKLQRRGKLRLIVDWPLGRNLP